MAGMDTNTSTNVHKTTLSNTHTCRHTVHIMTKHKSYKMLQKSYNYHHSHINTVASVISYVRVQA